jgi:hypothetical protein
MADKKQFSNTNAIVKVETGILFSGHFGQRIISLVIEAVKHSPFYI